MKYFRNPRACRRDHDECIDLFSIDINGNDHHIIDAVPKIKARLVVVEYNARFHPPKDWVQPYRANYSWQGGLGYGCSLVAWTNLFRRKGYSLVGCGIAGVNAFFMRDDLVGEHFARPFTAENHYEHPRHYINSFH